MLCGACVDDENIAGGALLQTGEHWHQVGRGTDGYGSTDHPEPAAVRAKLARQDA
jgi:hypothetical protein